MAKSTKKNIQEPAIEPLNFPEPEPIPTIEPETEPETPEEPAEETIITAEPASTEDPPKRGRGRPTNASANREETILDRLIQLDSWAGVWVYVYRQRPFTNKLLNGNKLIHVKRWDVPFDAEDLLKEAGSGVYLIRATRLNPATGKRPQFDMDEVRLLNMNYPPRIPPGEWVDHPNNKDWEWAKEAIFKKDAPPPPPPIADPMIELLREQNRAQLDAMNRQQDRMDKLQDEIRQNANKKDPGEQTLMSVIAPFVPAIVAKLTATPPPPPPPPDPFAMMTAALTFMEKVRGPEATAAAPRDPIAEAERSLEFVEKLESRVGGGRQARSRKSGLQETITDVAAAVGPSLAPFFQVMAANMIRAQQQQPAQQPGQIPPTVQLGPGPETAQFTPQQQQQPGPQLVKPKPTLEGISIAVLSHLNRRAVGLDLQDWFVEQFGEEEHDKLIGQGNIRLMEDLKKTPQWAGIESYAETGELNQLILEFLTVEDDEEEEDDGPPTAAKASAPIMDGWATPATQAQGVNIR